MEAAPREESLGRLLSFQGVCMTMQAQAVNTAGQVLTGVAVPTAADFQPAASPVQQQAAPAADSQSAALEQRFARLEALAKENQGLRSKVGRLESQMKGADWYTPEFVAAFSGFEQAKATLVQQGYSEDEIEILAQKPDLLKRLADSVAPTPDMKGADPLSEIAALRAENAALKAGKPANGGNPGNEPPAGRGAPVQDGPSHKEIFTNGKRLPSSAEIDRITAQQRASW